MAQQKIFGHPCPWLHISTMSSYLYDVTALKIFLCDIKVLWYDHSTISHIITVIFYIIWYTIIITMYHMRIIECTLWHDYAEIILDVIVVNCHIIGWCQMWIFAWNLGMKSRKLVGTIWAMNWYNKSTRIPLELLLFCPDCREGWSLIKDESQMSL